MQPARAPSPDPDRPPPAPWGRPALVCGFALLVLAGLLVNLGTRPLEMEEPRRALVALEMALRGNLIVPTVNGALYLNKPPLFNWVLLAFMRLSGSTAEWVLRLPTVLSMPLAALLLWAVARRQVGRGTALAAAAFLLTFTTLLFYGSLYAEIDLFYALVVLLQALAVFTFEQRDRPLALFVLSYLATAIGFLTKGMPSLAVQALTVAAWLLHERRWRWLFSWAHLAGIATLALCVGGYLAAYARTADPAPYLAMLLLDAAERTAADGTLHLARTALQLVAFPLQLASLAVPWVIFAPGLLTRAARARIRATPFLRFCVVFIAANVAPYWISPGNRPRYMFPFLPFLATLLAVGMEHLDERGWTVRAVRAVAGIALAAAAVGAAVFPFTPWAARGGPLWAWAPVAVLLAALAVWHWRARSLRPAVAALLLALPAARVGYDLIVPALRRAASEDAFFEQVAATLAADHRGERVLLAGSVRERRRRLPLLGRTFVFQDREYMPTSVSFHYSEEAREPLRWADRLEPGGLYLVHPRFTVDRPHDVVRVFDYPAGDEQDLELIRVRE